MFKVESKLADVWVTLYLDFLSRVGRWGYVRDFYVPSYRINDFNNNKFSLAMYYIHTMDK